MPNSPTPHLRLRPSDSLQPHPWPSSGPTRKALNHGARPPPLPYHLPTKTHVHHPSTRDLPPLSLPDRSRAIAPPSPSVTAPSHIHATASPPELLTALVEEPQAPGHAGRGCVRGIHRWHDLLLILLPRWEALSHLPPLRPHRLVDRRLSYFLGHGPTCCRQIRSTWIHMSFPGGAGGSSGDGLQWPRSARPRSTAMRCSGGAGSGLLHLLLPDGRPHRSRQ